MTSLLSDYKLRFKFAAEKSDGQVCFHLIRHTVLQMD